MVKLAWPISSRRRTPCQRKSAGKEWFNTPRLDIGCMAEQVRRTDQATEREPRERLRAQSLPWGMMPFMFHVKHVLWIFCGRYRALKLLNCLFTEG